MDNLGHFLYAGIFFAVFGLWYLVQSSRRLGMTRQRGIHFFSTHAYTCDFLCSSGRLKEHPLESILKAALAIGGFTLEFIAGAKDNWDSSTGLDHGKFATIYFIFALSALVDLSAHYGAPLSSDVDYLVSAFAFFVEWILFRFPRKYMSSELEHQLYTFLEYTILLCLLMVAMEMRNRKQAIFAQARGCAMLLQGSWICQMAVVMYCPSLGISLTDQEAKDLTLTTLFFSWHCAASVILTVLTGGLVGLVYRRKGLVLHQQAGEELQMQSLLKPNKNGKMIISLGSFTNEDDDDDDDGVSDIDYQSRRRRP